MGSSSFSRVVGVLIASSMFVSSTGCRGRIEHRRSSADQSLGGIDRHDRRSSCRRIVRSSGCCRRGPGARGGLRTSGSGYATTGGTGRSAGADPGSASRGGGDRSRLRPVAAGAWCARRRRSHLLPGEKDEQRAEQPRLGAEGRYRFDQKGRRVMKSGYLARAAVGLMVATALPGIALAQAWVPGSRNCRAADHGHDQRYHQHRLSRSGRNCSDPYAGGNMVAGDLERRERAIVLQQRNGAGMLALCLPFQAGQPVTLTSSCNAPRAGLPSRPTSRRAEGEGRTRPLSRQFRFRSRLRPWAWPRNFVERVERRIVGQVEVQRLTET